MKSVYTSHTSIPCSISLPLFFASPFFSEEKQVPFQIPTTCANAVPAPAPAAVCALSGVYNCAVKAIGGDSANALLRMSSAYLRHLPLGGDCRLMKQGYLESRRRFNQTAVFAADFFSALHRTETNIVAETLGECVTCCNK